MHSDGQCEKFRCVVWAELKSILPVEKVLGGYYRELGVTFNGGELIADRSTPTVQLRIRRLGVRIPPIALDYSGKRVSM